MDVERSLICKIVGEKDLAPAAEAGITPEFFLEPKNRHVFDTILRYNSEYGRVPTVSVMKADHPDYKFVRVEEPYQYLIDKVRENHTLALLQDGMSASVDAFDKRDAKGAMALLSQTLTKIAQDVPNTRDTDLTETGQDRLERYRALKDLPDGLRGIPTGFVTLDRATQGLQKQQLVTFVGPPKAGKSTLMLLAMMAAHQHGVRPLFLGFEMSNEEQEERFDAIRAQVSHSRLRNGTLKKSEWEKLERSIREVENLQSLYFSSDSMSATTLTGVAAKLDTIKPDVLFVDGIYMMDDENGEPKGSPQALTNLTRGFKRLAQNRDIPVAISTQVLEWKMSKKQGITSNSIGYSSSFAQDSDVILGVEKTEDESIQKLKVVLARNCPPLETFVQWDWETGTFEELSSDPFAGTEGGGWDADGDAF